MFGVNDSIDAVPQESATAAATGGTDWAEKAGNWAFDALNKVTMGAIYKNTGLNTVPVNQNNTAVVMDANGQVYPAGAQAAMAGLKQTGKTVQDVLAMNTTTMAIMAVGVAFFAWVLLKK